MKDRVAKLLCEACEAPQASEEYKALAKEWIENKDDADKTKEIAPKLREAIRAAAAAGCPVNQELQTLDHYLVKRSQWIIGGDHAQTLKAIREAEAWHLTLFYSFSSRL